MLLILFRFNVPWSVMHKVVLQGSLSTINSALCKMSKNTRIAEKGKFSIVEKGDNF